MGGVIKYSGIITKVRAMDQRLLKAEQFEELISLTTVPETLSFLKATKGYADSFRDVYEKDSHRDAIERRLMDSLYTDFKKLYRFADMEQRKFLDTYFLHYEIMIIKRCLRNVMNLDSLDVQLGTFTDFFHLHSKLSITALNNSDTLTEFMEAIADSPYEKLLRPIYEANHSLLWDYETALDLYYFSTVWSQRKKFLSSTEPDTVTAAFGTRIDLLNLQWIYRSLKHFSLSDMDIYPLLIPINYRLKPSQVQALAKASGIDEFSQILDTTYYKKYAFSENLAQLTNLSSQVLEHIYNIQSRKSPYSIATINRYLYRKEEEIHVLIRIIEGIRYRLPADEIRRYIK